MGGGLEAPHWVPNLSTSSGVVVGQWLWQGDGQGMDFSLEEITWDGELTPGTAEVL